MAKMKAKSKKTSGRRRVSISLDAPRAQEAFVMGDFNQWSLDAHPMKRNADGIWTKTLMLFPGSYEYKFMVDGEWWNDPAGGPTCANCFGTQNNVLLIPEK